MLEGNSHENKIVFFICFIIQDHTQHYQEIVFRAFDPVVIRLSLDSTNVQRERIVFELVKPYIAGFSVEPMDIDDADANGDEQEFSSIKRKSIETPSNASEAAEVINSSSSTKNKSKKNKKVKK